MFAVGICCAVLAFTSSGLAASSNEDLPSEFDSLVGEFEKSFGGFAESQKKHLYGALSAFQKNANYGDDWNRTLAGIELQVPWSIFFDSGANAAAALQDTGKQHIALNMMLVFKVIDKSRAAARYLVQEATKVPMQQVDTAAADSLGVDIEGHVIAWSLAHEVAHHLAGNVDAKASSLQESRQWELEADEKAYEILNRSGYSLYLLAQYVSVMERLESLRRRAGQVDPESYLDHPHWSTRNRRLQQYMSSVPPVNQRWASYSWFSVAPGSSQVTRITYVLPGNDIEHVATLLVNDSLAMVGVERQADKSAIIYIRDGDVVHQQRVMDTSKYVTAVRVGGQGGFYAEYLCFRSSFAAAAAGESSGAIARALRFDPVERIRAAIRAASMSPAKRTQADALLVGRVRASHDLLLDFYRGATTAEQYRARAQQTLSDYDSRLIATLGQQQFDAITVLLAGDVADIVGGFSQTR